MQLRYPFPPKLAIHSHVQCTMFLLAKLCFPFSFFVVDLPHTSRKKYVKQILGAFFKLACIKITLFNLFCIELYANFWGSFLHFRGYFASSPCVFFPLHTSVQVNMGVTGVVIETMTWWVVNETCLRCLEMTTPILVERGLTHWQA